jgi:hypothetical protein
MKTLILKEISRIDNLALMSVIDYWKDYDPKSVLLAIAELKRRGYPIPEELLLKKIPEFCTKNNFENINTVFSEYLKERGYNSYDEYYQKEMSLQSNLSLENSQNNFDNYPNNYDKYPALRTICQIYRISAWIVGIISIIVAILTIKIGIILSLSTIVIGGLIVLGLLATAELMMVFIDIERNTRK